jgi:ABC-type multidrug transport system fused ATPase/permease subunit
VRRNLREAAATKATVIVAHRLSSLKHADEILVLDHGRIVERGHHAELLALGGHYAALHRAQQIEEEIAAS